MPKDYEKPRPGDAVEWDGVPATVLADLDDPAGAVSVRLDTGAVLITDWRELSLPVAPEAPRG